MSADLCTAVGRCIIPTGDLRADSTGRRNTGIILLGEELIEHFARCFPPERFAGPGVHRVSDGSQLPGRVPAEISPFREVLPQKAVGVFVRAALPRALRIAEVDFQSALDAKPCVLSHLGSLTPGQRLTKRPGQFAHGLDDRRANGFSTVSGKRRAILDPLFTLIPLLARQVQQHRDARAAFDESADRRAVQAQDEIAFPMARDRPIFDRRWPFADHDGIAQEGLSTAAGPLARNTQSSTRAQASRQLPTQGTATLDIQGLVDRLVADAHGGILRVIDPKSMGDLLRAPRG
ncbi:Uncharacterised protein [Starkeya nomas]|uniref:Uncharacterized protein n=1 Tax=Starkeya nomas TaxID=2666134 RepID=A0A5S9P076_9HYPH|nr:Uncharacterised protein [Starkeya nomas]